MDDVEKAEIRSKIGLDKLTLAEGDILVVHIPVDFEMDAITQLEKLICHVFPVGTRYIVLPDGIGISTVSTKYLEDLLRIRL